MASVFSLLGWPGACEAAEAWHVIFPRAALDGDPRAYADFPRTPAGGAAPETVAKRRPELQIRDLSLDEAIRVALGNSEVVRVLAGGGAGATGSTIYDPAITNTEIDRARALFDPQFRINNTFRHDEDPGGAFFRHGIAPEHAAGRAHRGQSARPLRHAHGTVEADGDRRKPRPGRQRYAPAEQCSGFAAQSTNVLLGRSGPDPAPAPRRRNSRQPGPDRDCPHRHRTLVLPAQEQRAAPGPQRDRGLLEPRVRADRRMGSAAASRAGAMGVGSRGSQSAHPAHRSVGRCPGPFGAGRLSGQPDRLGSQRNSARSGACATYSGWCPPTRFAWCRSLPRPTNAWNSIGTSC